MKTVTLNSILSRSALYHAAYAKESTSDIVHWALGQFIKNPRLSIPIGWQTPDNQKVRTFTEKPYLEGPRDTFSIDEEMYSAVVNCSSLLGISVESLVDLALENECGSCLNQKTEWKESSSTE